jgi:hypothetical protein
MYVCMYVRVCVFVCVCVGRGASDDNYAIWQGSYHVWVTLFLVFNHRISLQAHQIKIPPK